MNQLDDSKLIETYNILVKSGKILTLDYIIQKLVDKKLIKNNSLQKTRFISSIVEHPEIFTNLSSFGHFAIGLKKWIPYHKKPTKKRHAEHNNIKIGNEVILFKNNIPKKSTKHTFSHKLSKVEIEESFLFIPSQLISFFNTAGDGFSLTVYCYGNYFFIAWVNSEYGCIHSPDILKFFTENHLQAGDLVYLEKKEDDPTGLCLYTKWQRYDMQKKTGRTRKNKLKNKEKDGGTFANPDYLLALIQKDDLVYKFLLNRGPSFVYEIANAISKGLGINRRIVDKLSFIDFSDNRIERLCDGKIGIVKNNMKVTNKEHATNNVMELHVRKSIINVIIATTAIAFMIFLLRVLVM